MTYKKSKELRNRYTRWMPDRPVEIVEFVSLGQSRTTSVEHGSDMNGRNFHTVWKRELCRDSCEWCEALVQRCKSRGGGVGGYVER